MHVMCAHRCHHATPQSSSLPPPFFGRFADGSTPTEFFKAAGSQDPGMAEEGIMAEIMERGPVSAAFYVFADFMHYAGGVYARSGGANLIGGHMIKIIGWGEEGGENYWIVQNSFGSVFVSRRNFR